MKDKVRAVFHSLEEEIERPINFGPGKIYVRKEGINVIINIDLEADHFNDYVKIHSTVCMKGKTINIQKIAIYMDDGEIAQGRLKDSITELSGSMGNNAIFYLTLRKLPGVRYKDDLRVFKYDEILDQVACMFTEWKLEREKRQNE